MEEIGDIELFQQVNDSIRPVVGRVLEADVEVPHNVGGAVGEACLPCHLEIIHPHCTVGGNVNPYDVEPLIASDKLEGQKVQGRGPYSPPEEAYFSLVLADCL